MQPAITESRTDPVGQFGNLQQARRLRQVTEHHPKRLGLFLRVYRGQASPRECIKAFCLECHGWEEAAIRDCCAPWPNRGCGCRAAHWRAWRWREQQRRWPLE
jgi:hypothetical protein